MATDSPPMDNISAQLSLKSVWQPGSNGIYGGVYSDVQPS